MTPPASDDGAVAEPMDRFNSYARPSTQKRVRAAVHALRTRVDADFTLARFVDEALLAHCQHLEQEHHAGRPWPDQSLPLPVGRRR